jgi:cell wall-associated NlpC family hydrolase
MADRRRFACNGRVAHVSLKGQVKGVLFQQGDLQSIAKPVVGLFAEPDGAMERQLKYGETFLVLEQDQASGHSFGRAEQDGYVGYVATDCLDGIIKASHKVTALNTHIYPAANIKTVPLMTLPLGAKLDIESIADGFGELRTGGYVPAQAIDLVDSYAADPVAVAGLFMGTAYLWGGDSYQGIDCSALVQTSLHACGQDCPRDSDMQQTEVGTEFGDNIPLQRGDLIFWKGHMGIMADAQTLIHANAYHMRVTAEPLADVAARILETQGLKIACRRRP